MFARKLPTNSPGNAKYSRVENGRLGNSVVVDLRSDFSSEFLILFHDSEALPRDSCFMTQMPIAKPDKEDEQNLVNEEFGRDHCGLHPKREWRCLGLRQDWTEAEKEKSALSTP